jgi:CheY-like chemotaxis protein
MVIHRTKSGHIMSNNLTWSDGAFILELRHVLRNIYDPDELKKSHLMQLLAISEAESHESLQNILSSAVNALKPDSSLSSQSDAWRIYNILNARYIQQFQQDEVARSVGLSPRQMRRLDRLALMTLAEYLWTHYRRDTPLPHNSLLDTGIIEGIDVEGIPAGQPNELTWLEKTQAKEVISAQNLGWAIQKTIEPLARSLNISIENEIPANLPELVVKLLPLRQAVLTLLTTVLIHSHGGKILIRGKKGPQGDLITIDARQIFSDQPVPYSDLVESLKISHQLVELSGGELEVLPAVPSSGFERIALTLPTSGQIVVLVVDDNEDTLLLFQRYLAKSPYRYIGARSFVQAMEVIEQTAPDIIVLDVMLPEIDGWELLERLRENPPTQKCPIIMCSILPQEQLALMFGAAAFIRKPVTLEAILTTLDGLSEQLQL